MMTGGEGAFFIIPETLDRERLDKALTNLSGYSRSQIQRWIQEGHVSHNAIPLTDCHQKIPKGTGLSVCIPESVEATPKAQQIPLDIVFEDTCLLVINKPAGLVVHPAPGHPENTMVNALLGYCGETLSGIGGVKRPGILHRLDKDTSGLMVVAKTDAAHQHLSKQFESPNGKILKRSYAAWLWGCPIPSSGVIEEPIARHPKDRQRMAVVKSGKNAQTFYHLEKTWSYKTHRVSRVIFTLGTGRTHQIRVHAQFKKWPLIGDSLYGKKGILPSIDIFSCLKVLPRQALHAYALSFQHPLTGASVSFNAPWPLDLFTLNKILDETWS